MTDAERIEILERALRWYADPLHYNKDDWGIHAVVIHPEYGQPGTKARNALKRVGLAAASSEEQN